MSRCRERVRREGQGKRVRVCVRERYVWSMEGEGVLVGERKGGGKGTYGRCGLLVWRGSMLVLGRGLVRGVGVRDLSLIGLRGRSLRTLP